MSSVYIYAQLLLVLRRLYPEAVAKHNYGTTLSSLTFAGTIVGMLVFGYLSDKVGRKFGMVRSLVCCGFIYHGLTRLATRRCSLLVSWPYSPVYLQHLRVLMAAREGSSLCFPLVGVYCLASMAEAP